MSEVKRVPIDSIKPHPDNPRIGDVNAIARSLERFGQVPGSVGVQRSTGTIVKGNHTWKAAKQLGWEYIDVVILDMDDSTATAYMLADNETSDKAENDKGVLLGVLGKNLSNLEGTGFTEDDFESLSEELRGEREEDGTPKQRPDIEGRDVEDAPEPTREIPLHVPTAQIAEFGQQVHDLQGLWKIDTFPKVVLRAVSEAHDRWRAGVGQHGGFSSKDAVPDELKIGAEF